MRSEFIEILCILFFVSNFLYNLRYLFIKITNCRSLHQVLLSQLMFGSQTGHKPIHRRSWLILPCHNRSLRLDTDQRWSTSHCIVDTAVITSVFHCPMERCDSATPATALLFLVHSNHIPLLDICKSNISPIKIRKQNSLNWVTLYGIKLVGQLLMFFTMQ